MAQENHRLPGFSFNVEEWDAEEQAHKTLANLPHARTGPLRVRDCGRREAGVGRVWLRGSRRATVKQ